MTTLCMCDLVETHADRVRRTLASVQTAVAAAPDMALHASPAPMPWGAAQREAARFRITSAGIGTAA